MDPSVVAAVIEEAKFRWNAANDIEVTLEANPTSVEAKRFEGYRTAGVNRVSLGIQALNDSDLRALGRLHSTREALAAFDIARTTFDRVSFDLIYARQHQERDVWKSELELAVSIAADHLSLYQLTIEDGTAFGARHKAGGLKGLPNEDLGADLYDMTQEICGAAGYPGYEISNHAVPGSESLHNLIYWNSGDYAGIGPGAHGRLTLDGQRYASETFLEPMRWLLEVEKAGSGELVHDLLTSPDRQAEFLLMGLRTRGGINTRRLASLGGDKYLNVINELVKDGLLESDTENVFATARGKPILNSVLNQILSS